MGAFEAGARRRIRKIGDELRRGRPCRQKRDGMRDRAGAGQCTERTKLDVRMPRVPVRRWRIRRRREAGMADLERKCAVGRRHEAGGNHSLKQKTNQQSAGDEMALAAMEKVTRHMANNGWTDVILAEGTPMPFELQPRLENQWIKLEPLHPSDFESLYSVASDPLNLTAPIGSPDTVVTRCGCEPRPKRRVAARETPHFRWSTRSGSDGTSR